METQLHRVRAIEVFSRVRWFCRLRWIAVVGLLVSSLFGPRLGYPSVWPSLLAVAMCVAGTQEGAIT